MFVSKATMTTDIFKFWDVPVRPGPHPADREVLERVDHGFDLTCLPGCFAGPLKTAPVVLLYLAPGRSDPDDNDARTRRGRDRYRRVRLGHEPLVGPEDHEVAWDWWSRRTKPFGHWQDLRTKVAVLNIGAYHSKRFADTPLLAALPSSRVSIDWAQSVLFPEATAGRRVVICLRSARFWGLQEGKRFGKALYAPHTVRSGVMRRSEMREQVIRKVRSVLAT